MKRLGLGLEKGPAKLTSYWKESEKRGGVPASSLIRWWFALRDDIRIGVDKANQVYSLETPTVRVLSQKQWMDAAGNRKDIADIDAAADAFADSFTRNFDELQVMHPIYGRLRHVFDLCVAMRIIRDEDKQAFSFLNQASISPHSENPVKWIPSISSWRKDLRWPSRCNCQRWCFHRGRKD